MLHNFAIAFLVLRSNIIQMILHTSVAPLVPCIHTARKREFLFRFRFPLTLAVAFPLPCRWFDVVFLVYTSSTLPFFIVAPLNLPKSPEILLPFACVADARFVLALAACFTSFAIFQYPICVWKCRFQQYPVAAWAHVLQFCFQFVLTFPAQFLFFFPLTRTKGILVS